MPREETVNRKIADVQAKLENPMLPQWRKDELQSRLDDLRDQRYACRVKEKIEALEARVAALEAK